MSKARQILNKLNETIFRGSFESKAITEINPELAKHFEAIAKDMLDIETLQTRHSDSLDFHDISVWGLVDIMYRCTVLGANNPNLIYEDEDKEGE